MEDAAMINEYKYKLSSVLAGKEKTARSSAVSANSPIALSGESCYTEDPLHTVRVPRAWLWHTPYPALLSNL